MDADENHKLNSSAFKLLSHPI